MCKIFLLCAMVISSALSLDYQFDGWISSWNKKGFNINNPKYIDASKGIFPTESYSALSVFLGVNMQLLKGNSSSLDFGFSGTAGEILYDSTKSDRTADGSLYVPDGFAYNYVGYWVGYLGNVPYGQLDAGKFTHNVLFPTTYLHYNSEFFEFWGGRYPVASNSYADLFSSYTQGLDLVFKYKDFRAFFEASFGRANASWAGWIYDWYSPYSITTKKGYQANLGMYFIGMDYRKNGLTIRPNFYFYPTLYYIPSLKVSYETSPEFLAQKGWGSDTRFLIFTPFSGPNAMGKLRYGNYNDKFSVSVDFTQTFKISFYNIGLGVHKNFGNANGYLGNRGNTVLMIDIWDNSVYDIGQSVSNTIGADAFTPYLFGGGHIKDFDWSVLGRLTYSRRANEQAIRIGGSYNFKKEGILVGAFVEFFKNETKPGYQVGSYAPPSPNNPGNTSDRSYLAIYMKYNFLK
ncbi:outer membrane family protein [Helicobacter cappadocius]|uniref:Outer membrane family protein n=1 Tax=Helicobacter cappadocius TaxID=3063998 RepID=A0AA90TEA6_9HELI|nr:MULTISPECIES: outer membrane family protein [unclassified Helicobacter]MDO7252533.1 outer membrane family protein [Helicobacter sp. faydin-H75]MDP2538400.1 outer membrane family protein [Helicobacter sp. faydin-H76]